MLKRSLSLIICLVMLTSAFAGTGLTLSADEGVTDTPAASASINEGIVTPYRATASGTCGTNLTWSLDTSTGVLTIDGTGYMTDYEYKYSSPYTTAPWGRYYSYIKSVVIGNSVTTIGYYAFRSCTSLTSVTIPDSVTTIGVYAFSSCTSLTSVTIPDSVTSIGGSAFESCTALKSVTIPDSVSSIGSSAFKNTAYYNNSSNWKNNVLYIGNHLIKANTSILGDYSIKDGTLTIADSAFLSCDSLTNVIIPDSVTSIGVWAFYYCTSFTSVTIPDSVTSIGDSAFYNTAYYKNNSNWENDVLYIGNHLIIAKSSISGDYSIKDGTGCIADSAFLSCDSLTNVIIPDSVKSIGDYAFAYCTSLTSVTVDECNQYYASVDGVLYNKDITELIQYPIGNTKTSFTIPDSVTSIGGSAFESCTALKSVTIGNSVTSISYGAFYNCTSLTSVTIPDSVTSIGDYAFRYYDEYYDSYCKLDITIKCYENSYAHTYAVDNGFAYELLVCNHEFTNYVSNNDAICTADGTKTAKCERCDVIDTVIDEGSALGHTFTEYIDYKAATCTEDATRISYCDRGCGAADVIAIEGTALGHTWSEWITSLEPTYTTDGEKIRFCLTCKLAEGEKIPALEPPYDPDKPVITVDNFTVTITNADNIKDMRYALGEYTTTAEIRNAEGNVALDNGVVSANTLDGNFIYEMPNGGHYTIWIRMKDGTNYILPLDVTNVTASVSTYGVKITVHDIYNVKDIYIAKGEYQTYREIKDNGYIVALSANKIGGKHDYTYTVYEPGVHTILVRYNDGRNVLFHEELTVTEPTFTTNGLQVTIGNIEDVKVIRTAYGEYNTPGDTKRAAGARNFSGKSVIKGAEEYMIQYREDGMVTIIVEYNNGYIKVFHYNVQHKQADCMQTMSTVLFDNLNGFVIIRYAPGEYTSSAEIKRAKGSKYIKPADLTGEYAIVSGLAKGTYTFCVQFDDDSYNYFTVTVD